MKVGVCEHGSGAGVGSTARGVPTRNTWALDGGCGGALGNRMILGPSARGVLGVPTQRIWGVPLLEISSPGRHMMEGLVGLTVPGEAACKVVLLRWTHEPGTWITLGEVCLNFVRL